MEHLLQREEINVPVTSFAAACQGMAVLHGVAAVFVEVMGVDFGLLVVNSVMLRVDVKDPFHMILSKEIVLNGIRVR